MFLQTATPSSGDSGTCGDVATGTDVGKSFGSRRKIRPLVMKHLTKESTAISEGDKGNGSMERGTEEEEEEEEGCEAIRNDKPLSLAFLSTQNLWKIQHIPFDQRIVVSF